MTGSCAGRRHPFAKGDNGRWRQSGNRKGLFAKELWFRAAGLAELKTGLSVGCFLVNGYEVTAIRPQAWCHGLALNSALQKLVRSAKLAGSSKRGRDVVLGQW